MGHLLGKNGRDAHREFGRKALFHQIGEYIQDRNIGLRGGLVEPIRAVGPATVGEHVRQVGMQDEGEAS